MLLIGNTPVSGRESAESVLRCFEKLAVSRRTPTPVSYRQRLYFTGQRSLEAAIQLPSSRTREVCGPQGHVQVRGGFFAADAWEIVQKVVQGVACFQAVHQVPRRHPRSGEDELAAHHLGISRDDTASFVSDARSFSSVKVIRSARDAWYFGRMTRKGAVQRAE